MASIQCNFTVDQEALRSAVEQAFAEAKDARDAADIASFAKRVRLPFSGAVAARYSRFDAWKRERVERRAQAAFERGWV